MSDSWSKYRSKASCEQVEIEDAIYGNARISADDPKDEYGYSPRKWQARSNFGRHVESGFSNFDFDEPGDCAELIKD